MEVTKLKDALDAVKRRQEEFNLQIEARFAGPSWFCSRFATRTGRKTQRVSRLCGPRLCTVYQYAPHKAVAEFSKIANYRRLVAVNQSETTAGPTSGWRLRSVVEVVVVPVVVVVVVVVLQSGVL